MAKLLDFIVFCFQLNKTLEYLICKYTPILQLILLNSDN